jgi:hypothetical protein
MERPAAEIDSAILAHRRLLSCHPEPAPFAGEGTAVPSPTLASKVHPAGRVSIQTGIPSLLTVPKMTDFCASLPRPGVGTSAGPKYARCPM